MSWLKLPSILLWLGLCALCTLAVLAFTEPANAQQSEEFAFRVAARLHPNGTHLEFGIQRIDDQGHPRLLHLEFARFAALDTGHHRWLHGEPSALRIAPHYDENPPYVTNAKVRVVARLHPTRGLFQFGAQYKLDASQLPGSDVDDYAPMVFDRKQFFPEDIGHHRWLYTGVFRFTRVWAGAGSMEAAPTLADEHGNTGEPETIPAGAISADYCVASIRLDVDAMIDDGCETVVSRFCVDAQDIPWCRMHHPQSEQTANDESDQEDSESTVSTTEAAEAVESTCRALIGEDSEAALPDECAEVLVTYCAEQPDAARCVPQDADDEHQEVEQAEAGESEQKEDEKTVDPRLVNYSEEDRRCIEGLSTAAMVAESCHELRAEFCAEHPQYQGCPGNPIEPQQDDEWESSSDDSGGGMLGAITLEECLERISLQSTEDPPSDCADLLADWCEEHPQNAWCRRQRGQ